MLHRPWVAFLFIILVRWQTSWGAPTSLGPTSNTEAQILWNSAQTAFQGGHYDDVAHSLQRYLDRYPGQPHFQQARFVLGKSFVQLGEFEKAIPLLREFISKSKDSTALANARIQMGYAYLGLSRFDEAYLSMMELSDSKKQASLPPELLIEKTLIQAESLFRRQHYKRAALLIEPIQKQVHSSSPARLRAKLALLQMNLKTQECSRFPGKGALTETQIQDQMQRRGTCLFESLIPFRAVIQTGHLALEKEATQDLIQNYKSYMTSCSSRSLLASHRPLGTRTPAQVKSYEEELNALLTESCGKQLQEAFDFVKTWKFEFQPLEQDQLQILTHSLSTLIPHRGANDL